MRRSGFQTLFAIVISFLIPIYSASPYYQNFIKADFHSFDVSFENPDSDDVVIDHHELQVSERSGISDSPVPLANSLNEPFRFFLQMAFLYHDTSILRC